MATIRIPIIRNASYKLDGPGSYAYALNKYQILTHTDNHKMSKIFAKDKNTGKAAVSADNIQNDSFYTCPVEIGGQTVDLDLDSGSADMVSSSSWTPLVFQDRRTNLSIQWVWSTKLEKRVLRAGQEQHIKVYDHKKSSTYQDLPGYTWAIRYGDGSGASGTVGTDHVKIGGLTIKDQAVEMANKLSSQFQNETSSGLLGLAFGNINTVSPEPVKTPGKLDSMYTSPGMTNLNKLTI